MAKDSGDKPEEKLDRSDELFRREVDEAVREQEFQEFWSKYGLWLIAALLLGLAALAGWIFYQNERDEQSALRSEEFSAAVDSARDDNLDGASNALKPLEEAEQDGYRAAAQIMQANIAIEKNDPKKAIAGYKKIAADEKLPQPFRDLALIRQTAAEFDTLKPQQIVDRLKSLAVPGSPWFGSAGEMVAISYMNMEKEDLAGPLFAQLAKDKQVPQTVRSRAVQMAGLMGIDVVDALRENEEKSEDDGGEQDEVAEPKEGGS